MTCGFCTVYGAREAAVGTAQPRLGWSHEDASSSVESGPRSANSTTLGSGSVASIQVACRWSALRAWRELCPRLRDEGVYGSNRAEVGIGIECRFWSKHCPLPQRCC